MCQLLQRVTDTDSQPQVDQPTDQTSIKINFFFFFWQHDGGLYLRKDEKSASSQGVPLNNIIKEITDNKCTICGEPETMMHQLFFCNNAKHLWDIGRKILGTGELSLVEQDSSTVANLKEVSPSIINEIIKSVIFKLLIQIDRSSNLNELDTRRTIAHWMSIEYQALSKTFKNNKLQLAYLQSILSKLRG